MKRNILLLLSFSPEFIDGYQLSCPMDCCSATLWPASKLEKCYEVLYSDQQLPCRRIYVLCRVPDSSMDGSIRYKMLTSV